MAKIEDSGSAPAGPSKDDMTSYRRECGRAADLFQQALEERQTSKTDPNKQAEMERIMDKAKHIMDQTVNAMKHKEITDREKKLVDDYAQFKKEPSETNKKQLDQDVSDLKGSL